MALSLTEANTKWMNKNVIDQVPKAKVKDFLWENYANQVY